MLTNLGIKNEIIFVNYLNKKKVGQLNPLFRDLIDELFDCHENDEVKCWKNDLPQKADIFIAINNQVKGISIKMGAKNSVHVERITDFIHFLIECGIRRENVIRYLEYHYADGTRNGKGINRMSTEEYKVHNIEDINEINKDFNKAEIIQKVINRFVIRGNNSDTDIDAIIYGWVNDFLWITKDDIIDIISSKSGLQSSGVHFACLYCQPKARNLNHNPKYEKDRYCVQIKWFSLFDDIIEHKNNKIMNSRQANNVDSITKKET